MSKRYARNPGSDQIAKWKAAVAALHKQQRQQRGNPSPASEGSRIGPGMVRRRPARRDGDGGRDGDGPAAA